MLRQLLYSALVAAARRLLRHVGLASVLLAAAAMLVSPAHARSYWYNVTGTVFGYQKTIGFQVMLPDDVPNIRGLVFGFSGQCGDWRGTLDDQIMAPIGFGVLTLNSGNLWTPNQKNCLFGNLFSDEPSDLFTKALAGAAQASGRPELNNVPIGLFGYSQGGLNSQIVAYAQPERIVSLTATRGVSGQVQFPEALKSVPGLLMAGSLDSVVSPTKTQHDFESYRNQDAEYAYLLHWDQGHTQNYSRRHGVYSDEMMFFWHAEVIKERYPAGVLPSPEPGNPVVLRDIPIEEGWLVETPKLSPSLTVSSFPEIAPYDQYTGDVADASWVPNEAVANVYRAYAAIDPTRPNPRASGQYLSSAIEFVLPRSVYQSPKYHVGDNIVAIIDPHEFDDLNTITEMEFFDGDELIGVDTEGPVWSMEFVPDEPGVHALVANATDEIGNRAATFRVVVVDHALGLLGDYTGNGQVEQADLDLVLLNWGTPWPGSVDGWLNDPPTDGTIGQNELDKVRLHWGNTSAAVARTFVPEPACGLQLMLAVVPLLIWGRSAGERSKSTRR